jgi:DNA-binding FadR family transcriptional regulator
VRYKRVAREDLSTGVARQLRSAILTGAHQPGELLAPERELAAQFGVDRHTLRSALSELEQLGLVKRRQGSGCRVLDFRETGTLELIKFLVVKPGTDEIDLTMVAPVMEVGRVTLQGLMDLVVERADRDDLAAMRVELDALGGIVADGGDAASIIDSERRFFRLVFRGAHSLVAELLANTFDQIFDAAIDPEGRVRLHWDDVLVSSGRLDAYRRVVEAIEQRDAAEARHLLGIIVDTIPAAVATAVDEPAGRRPRRRRLSDESAS